MGRQFPLAALTAADGGANSAISAVDIDATAFVHRDKLFTFQCYASKPSSASSFPSYGVSFVTKMRDTIISNMPSDWAYGIYAN